MAIYSYDQFENAAKAAGMYETFSDADLNLARQNPDAGMSILKYKQDYANATTDEARALANQGAEGIRSSYGGYTGGSDGGSFHLNQLSPSSFMAQPAPAYENKYADTEKQLMEELLSREKFTYDPASDPSYSAYKKQAAREGKRAMEDTVGAASAMTGGIPSSYAVTAASQARDYYAAQAADKMPELEQMAYERYLNDYNMKLSDLDVVRTAAQAEYDKYLNALDQHNADRNFKYGQLLDQIDHQSNVRAEDLEKATIAAQHGDYSLLADLGITADTYDRDFQRKYEEAVLKYQYGDDSGLRALGISPKAADNGSEMSFDDKVKLAELAAKYGDDSYLAELGIETPEYKELRKINELKELYGGTVIPASMWEIVAAASGGEEWLTANGFSKAETEASTEKSELYTQGEEYAKEWAASGVTYDEILERLSELPGLSPEEALQIAQKYAMKE